MAAAARREDPVRRVLVVEDDSGICDLIGDILDDAGYDAHCVQSDRAAYSVLSGARTYDALIVDINLGAGTTGFDVARFARQMRPDMAVMYVTGQASAEAFRAFGVPNSGYLAKPFEAEDLVLTLETLLDA
jgi:DNA-binding response OmpR family regulator